MRGTVIGGQSKVEIYHQGSLEMHFVVSKCCNLFAVVHVYACSTYVRMRGTVIGGQSKVEIYHQGSLEMHFVVSKCCNLFAVVHVKIKGLHNNTSLTSGSIILATHCGLFDNHALVNYSILILCNLKMLT